MSTYRVYMGTEASTSVEVQAEDREDAIEKAYEKFQGVILCHQCAHEVDLGDFEVPVDKDYAVELVE
ncbi:hypothetical protein [Kribbella italica]|uniref:Uncharacterized protein n=1 Tax=Kribbella italica TaxID=1540520 RepID=A0A7W9MRX3_9ACTN|nr:hypothetical protein [Kribbella italica]MBB5833460.1 hypothetical protein [Kribbella italica]